MTNTDAESWTEGSEVFTVRCLQNKNEKEVSAIVSLVQKCYRTKGNWTNEADILEGMRVTPEDLAKEAMHSQFFVVEEEQSKRLIGCVKTGVVTETVVGPLSEPTGYLGMLAVSEDFQSRGVGTKLVRIAEEHCRRLGVEKMSLDVLGVREDVIAWYERSGYKKTGHFIDSAPFFKRKGEVLLKRSNFILLQKPLTSLRL